MGKEALGVFSSLISAVLLFEWIFQPFKVLVRISNLKKNQLKSPKLVLSINLEEN